LSLEITGAIIVGLAGLLIATPFLVRKRLAVREKAAAWKLGFDFRSRVPEDFFRHLTGFDLLQAAMDDDIFNIMFRTDRDRRFAVFTVESGGPGRSTITRTVRVFFAASPAFHLPHFKLVPKNLSHRIEREPDINFPDNPTFSRRFLLQGEPEEQVRALFHPRLLEYLVGRRELEMEGRDNCLIVIDHRASLTRLVREGLEIVALVGGQEGFPLDPEQRRA
jgi:hypothetical protein